MFHGPFFTLAFFRSKLLMKMKKGLILIIRPHKDYKYNEADSKELNKKIAGKAGRREAIRKLFVLPACRQNLSFKRTLFNFLFLPFRLWHFILSQYCFVLRKSHQ